MPCWKAYLWIIEWQRHHCGATILLLKIHLLELPEKPPFKVLALIGVSHQWYSTTWDLACCRQLMFWEPDASEAVCSAGWELDVGKPLCAAEAWLVSPGTRK